jgi:hypothetical protein
MTLAKTMRRVAALGALAFLAACGSEQSDRAQLLRSLPAALVNRDAQEAPAPVTAEQIGTIVAATQDPLMLVEIENRKSRFVIQQIERNGPYVTYGNAARQAIVYRDGMVVQTRGLGGDLMSTDETALLSMLRNRQTGTAPLVMRFLTPEDVIRELDFTCLVTTEGNTVPVTLGALSTTGLVLSADCNNPELRVSSTYVVAPDGYVVSARQWLGETLGHVNSQSLQR